MRKINIFTLIELLVCIAIIAILATLLFPSLMKVKQMGRQTQCLNGLKQIGISFTEYANDYNGWLPESCGANGIYWMNKIREYLNIKSDVVYTQERTCGIFKCPSWEVIPDAPVNPGLSYGFNYNVTGKQLSRISNSGSTVLLADRSNNAYSSTPSYNDAYGGTRTYGFSQRHLGKSNILFCDMHVGSRTFIYPNDLRQ